jgi:hypothetical protein
MDQSQSVTMIQLASQSRQSLQEREEEVQAFGYSPKYDWKPCSTGFSIPISFSMNHILHVEILGGIRELARKQALAESLRLQLFQTLHRV